MSDHLRVPLANSLPAYTQDQALQAIQLTGRALPCSVSAINKGTVTVNFEVNSAPFTLPPATMPIATWVYIQAPVQIGDKGYAAAADAYLGGMSGLGGGVADLTQRGNLSALVFVPLGNTAWARRDANAVEITGHGSSGLDVQDGTGATRLIVNSAGVTIIHGGETITIGGAGMTFSGGDLIFPHTTFLTHVHSGVQSGSSDTGPPV